MKKIYSLLLPAVLSSSFCIAQTFYVSGRDPKSIEVIQKKIKFEGYKISSDSLSSDYTVDLLSEGAYNFFKMSYGGYVKISSTKSGEEITRTKVIKRNPAVANGYNASYNIFSVIAKRYLEDELKKCKKDN